MTIQLALKEPHIRKYLYQQLTALALKLGSHSPIGKRINDIKFY